MPSSPDTPQSFLVAQLAERFRSDPEWIGRLLGSSDDFVELCQDWLRCLDSERSLAAAPVPDLERMREYRLLKAQLEGEIRACLAGSHIVETCG